MADSDGIFLAVNEPLDTVVEWVGSVLGLEPVVDEGNDRFFRGAAKTFDGWVGFAIGNNIFALGDPEPDEVQAMDEYPVYIDVQCRHRKDAQSEEARLAFEALVRVRSEVPALLSHNVTLLIAAHLASRGTHYFDSKVTLDVEDRDTWQPWVVSAAAH